MSTPSFKLSPHKKKLLDTYIPRLSSSQRPSKHPLHVPSRAVAHHFIRQNGWHTPCTRQKDHRIRLTSGWMGLIVLGLGLGLVLLGFVLKRPFCKFPRINGALPLLSSRNALNVHSVSRARPIQSKRARPLMTPPPRPHQFGRRPQSTGFTFPQSTRRH